MQATDKTTMPRYPEIGEVPEHQHLTVCEVLTWIGYSRAIPKEVYFAPFVEASGITHDEKVALLHRSVPDPKPLEDPMDDAERTLMDLVRTKRLSLLIEQNGSLVDAPAEIYEYAVTVNARGCIEADWTATERDRKRALSYLDSRPPIGTVVLRKAQVLEALPQSAPAATPPAGAPTKPEPELTSATEPSESGELTDATSEKSVAVATPPKSSQPDKVELKRRKDSQAKFMPEQREEALAEFNRIYTGPGGRDDRWKVWKKKFYETGRGPWLGRGRFG